MTTQGPHYAVLMEYLRGGAGDLSDRLPPLLAQFKARLEDGRLAEAAFLLRQAVRPDLDYTSAQSLVRAVKKLRSAGLEGPKPLRLAVLGGFTTTQLCQLIDLYLFAAGADVELYEAEYGIFRQEILDESSGLYAHKPSLVFLAVSWRDLTHLPTISDDRAAVRAKVQAELDEWAQLWRTAHQRLGCQIIQNNFEEPPWRALGNLEKRHPASLGRFISLVNHELAEAAPAYVTVHDVDHLSAAAGRWNWSDARFFHHAKMPCGPEHLCTYAHSVASVIASQAGLSHKCLVLDLDNTLWGGVVGDDGLGGIRLGHATPEGEAYLAFQQYLKELRLRGVVLAVCSKNEDAIAREAFEKHPEMVLRLDDISCFVANWNDKAANLRQIAAELNIGLNSLVFVDDNPAERELVRTLAPEVAVPELPEDPSGYIQALEKHRYFQLVSLNAEDIQRTNSYKANAARKQAQAQASNIEEFLQALDMTGLVQDVNEHSLERTVQLLQRSNQFNLTTRRHTAAQVMAMMSDPAWETTTITLKDRYGDNGLISVLLARREGRALVIDTWVMSCRVLKRGVEHLALNHLARQAARRGLDRLRGEYIPTPKNILVKDHYASLGFAPAGTDTDGRTWWELDLADWTDRPHFIKETATDATA
ncbi:MAG: hypothetical protein BWX88_02919 [Planctomycetes bacterium ADurb.Bin126]|nr:MAG: hypothetical protein BWX88_02919 [Planctomycetes bacterium ADurb.Bin126]HOD83370.1 HAD-IIIC family phosphatase [Phycisphaerae bacterium]HQL74108.1 HAD-IIIC family phosphatase [Phycisphaerae bacterium]